ncbi:hypothetical protein EV122DRAFT_255046 [Schizophyllum commune]
MSFDAFTLASSGQARLTASSESVAHYTQVIVDLQRRVQELQTLLAEEQEKSRELTKENAVLLAQSAPCSTASQGGSESASAGSGRVRTSNSSLQHLHADVLAAECDIRPFACRASIGLEPWLEKKSLMRVVSPENAALLAARAPGARPRYLIGANRLSVDHPLFDDKVQLDLQRDMSPLMSAVYGTSNKHAQDMSNMVFTLASSTRYNIVHSIKDNIGRVLNHHNLPPDLFSDSESKDALRQSPEVAYLLGRKPGSAKISLQPRILFGLVEGHVGEVAFGNRGIIRALQIIMFGEKSLDKPKKKNTVSKSSSAYKWGLSTVTPGMIAWAAILIIYALSGDPELAHVGSYTGFEYKTNYRIYFGLLEMSWNDGNTRALVNYINNELFSHLPLYPRADMELIDDHADDDHSNLVAAMQGGSVPAASSVSDPAARSAPHDFPVVDDPSEPEDEQLGANGVSPFPALARAPRDPPSALDREVDDLSVPLEAVAISGGTAATSEGANSALGNRLRVMQPVAAQEHSDVAVATGGSKTTKAGGKGKGKGRAKKDASAEPTIL